MGFEVGDFVRVEKYENAFRIVTHLQIKSWPKDVGVLYLLEDATSKDENWAHGDRVEYIKTNPTNELINSARVELEKASNCNKIDNLTYIEICAKLREYEQSL